MNLKKNGLEAPCYLVIIYHATNYSQRKLCPFTHLAYIVCAKFLEIDSIYYKPFVFPGGLL